MSSSFEKIWQRKREDLYADKNVWLEGIHEDDRQRVAHSYSEIARTGSFEEVYRIVRPDGSMRWVLDFGHLVQGRDGAHAFAHDALDLHEVVAQERDDGVDCAAGSQGRFRREPARV